MSEAEAVALLLLPLAGFVVLEPIEHVLAFDLTVLAELHRDLLDLLRVGSSHPPSVQHLQYSDLLLRRVPTCPSRVCFHLHERRSSHAYIKYETSKSYSNFFTSKTCILFFQMTLNGRRVSRNDEDDRLSIYFVIQSNNTVN